MAKPKQYRCLNVGNCDKANNKEKFSIPEGEDLKCPECGQNMLQEVKGGLPAWVFALVAVAVIAIAAIVFWPKGGESATPTDPQETEQVEDGEDEAYDETEEPEDDGSDENEAVADTVIVEKVDTVVIDNSRVDTVVVEKEKTVVVNSGLTNYNLGWGLYTGEGKSGKPHGVGDVKVTKSYSIDLKSGGKTIDVNNGDRIIKAKFDNGNLVRGTVKFSDGTTKSFNIGV